MKFFAWLKDVFRNDDIVSAFSGAEIEPPFYSHDRKRRTQVYTTLGYIGTFVGALIISILFPEGPPVEEKWDPPSLVFLIEPGPGGGGGGGDGSEEPLSLQQLEGQDAATVAVKVEVPEEKLVFEDPDVAVEEEDACEPPPDCEDWDAEACECRDDGQIKAPVVAMAPDDLNTRGDLDGEDGLAANAGAGNGGGIGEGDGSGLGPGTGGGFGGGAYRMGSGITPPILRKQVRPQYTQDALAKKIEGTVDLEVVILKGGRVGEVRILQSLGGGLNDQAISCVRQWIFVPAKFKGDPVDVIVSIAVDFAIY